MISIHNASSLKKALIGNSLILISTIFWGVNYAFTKALIPDWMSAEGVVIARLAGGCALFWLASLFTKNDAIPKEDMKRIALGGIIGLFGCIYLFVVALKYGSAIDISIIMTSPPASVILMEVLFMRRRPDLMEYAGIVISFAGAALVILGGNHDHQVASNYLLGDGLAVAASICFAIYLVVLAKPTARYKPVSLLRWVFLFAALPTIFMIPDVIHMPIFLSNAPIPWLEIGFIVVCPTFLAYLLLQPAERDIGSVLVSLYQYLTPVVAAISAILMGVDRLRWIQVFAILIIVAGMLLTNIGKKRDHFSNPVRPQSHAHEK